jgi:aryl-alcohol dehydrogenase-like predicted oxidoreductase
MSTRQLGASNLQVPTLCLGGNVFGWTVDESASFAILDAAFAAGLNFIDTADVYSKWVPGNQGGESEAIIGKWMKRTGKRASVVVATKVGMEMGPAAKGLSQAYILRAVDDSLRRLQTDYIDLYQSHTDDAATPLEEMLETYAGLIRQGKVRVIGASNYTAKRLEQALRVSKENNLPRYECLQPHYNLCERAGYEAALEPLCRKHGVGVIPYFPLASGFLTGKYRSPADLAGKARAGMVKPYLNERGLRILQALDQVAKEKHCSVAAVALAWLIARPGITAPIASVTSPAQLQDLIAATVLRLDDDSIAQLNEASI